MDFPKATVSVVRPGFLPERNRSVPGGLATCTSWTRNERKAQNPLKLVNQETSNQANQDHDRSTGPIQARAKTMKKQKVKTNLDLKQHAGAAPPPSSQQNQPRTKSKVCFLPFFLPSIYIYFFYHENKMGLFVDPVNMLFDPDNVVQP